MHLSVAIDTPTIALIGPMPLERVGPMGNRHRAIQCERLSERERNHRKTDMRPMLSIQTDVVIDACDSLLSSLAKSMSTKEHQNRYHSDAA
jgi:ADP-heptose:LPS heptosyltransferase